ncbi:MAG: FecR domain-containing protein [Oligoflexales bacterium]
MIIKYFLLVLWLALIGVNILAWQKVDWFFDRHKEHKAILMKVDGQVKSRPKDLTIWRTAGKGRKFYGEEILATEKDSTAVLVFQGGRSIELGSNSQLAIGQSEASPSSSDTAMTITLLKGNAKVENKPTKDSENKPLEVQSGDVAIELDQKNSSVIQLSKSVKKETADVFVASGSANLINVTTGEVSKINKKTHSKPIEPEIEEPSAIISSLPKVSIIWPQNRMSLWTTRPLNGQKGFLPVRVALQGGGPSQEWEAFVLLGRQSYPVQNGQAKIPVNFLKNANTTTLGYRIQLQVGARFRKPLYQTQSGRKEKIERNIVSFEIRSLLALPPKVRISLPRIQQTPIMESGWFLQKGKKSHNLIVNIYSHQDIVKMAPVLNAAKYFHIVSTPPEPNGKEMYLSRGGQIIASAQGVKNTQDLRTLKSVLNADVVFYGPASALHPLTFDQKGLQILRSREQVYVSSQGRMSPVKTEVLLEDAAARNFVLQSADGVFLQPVQVLEVR